MLKYDGIELDVVNLWSLHGLFVPSPRSKALVQELVEHGRADRAVLEISL